MIEFSLFIQGYWSDGIITQWQGVFNNDMEVCYNYVINRFIWHGLNMIMKLAKILKLPPCTSVFPAPSPLPHTHLQLYRLTELAKILACIVINVMSYRLSFSRFWSCR